MSSRAVNDSQGSGLDGLRSPGLLLGHAGRSRSEEPPEVIVAPRRPRFEMMMILMMIIIYLFLSNNKKTRD